MKRVICLIIALACVVSQAQTMRMLNIFKHDGSIDTTQLSNLDSVTIGNNLPNLVVHPKTGSNKTIPLAQIDSMFCLYKDGPVYDIKQPPASGQVYHVGDSVTITWNFNKMPAGEKAEWHMSIDGGKTWKWLTNLVCYMMYKNPISGPCYNGIDYVPWPYVVTNGKYVGTWKFKIENPMNMPDAMADKFNPISDSVVVRLEDYVDHSIWGNSAMFKVRP